MAFIVYQDETVVEWSDGTADVSFSEAEWAAMEADPVRFGLALDCGHSPSQYSPAEGCMACFERAEWLCGLSEEELGELGSP